jgi:integrase
MRPSEALGLCWGDVDLRRGEISISKSRYLGAESGTKTAGSERVIKLHPSVVGGLREPKKSGSESPTRCHTFISIGLTNGLKIKWLAEYCGTSVAMIEKHYGKYLGGDTEE